MIVERVISGGQTGADQAGWRAARAAGIATGGWMPRGFRTEDGDRPEFEGLYGARDTGSRSYPERTAMNASRADGTVFFGHASSGYGATYWACVESGRPFYRDDMTTPDGQRDLADWIVEHRVAILNVAGNRETSNPGIGARVEEYLAGVFRLLKEGD